MSVKQFQERKVTPGRALLALRSQLTLLDVSSQAATQLSRSRGLLLSVSRCLKPISVRSWNWASIYIFAQFTGYQVRLDLRSDSNGQTILYEIEQPNKAA